MTLAGEAWQNEITIVIAFPPAMVSSPFPFAHPIATFLCLFAGVFFLNFHLSSSLL